MGNIDPKNLITAIALSLAVFLSFEYFYNLPRLERERALQAERQATTAPQTPAPSAPAGVTAPTAPGVASPAPAVTLSRDAAIAGQKRVQIRTPRLEGSILLTGGRLDDLRLTNYRETVDRGSPAITLLSPQGTQHPYFAESGWVATRSASRSPMPTRSGPPIARHLPPASR